MKITTEQKLEFLQVQLKRSATITLRTIKAIELIRKEIAESQAENSERLLVLDEK